MDHNQPLDYKDYGTQDGSSHQPLKDVNGNTMYHVNPDGSLGAVWYQDEPRPKDWIEGGRDPSGADVADAIENVGNDPDKILKWLQGHNFRVADKDHIPKADFTPGVDDDFDAPPNGLDGLGAVGATKSPTSVVPEVPENFTFDKLRAAFANVSGDSPVDLSFSQLWKSFGDELVRNTQEFATQFAASAGWEGETAKAVKANVMTFTDLSKGPIVDLSAGMKALGVLEDGFSRTLMWIAKDAATDAPLLDALHARYPNYINFINSQFDTHAQSVIRTVYNPAIQTIAQGNPSFGTAPPVSVDPNNPDGGGGAGGGGGGDGGIGDEINKALKDLGGGGGGDNKGGGGDGGIDDDIAKSLKNLGANGGGGDGFDPNAIANALKTGGGGGDGFDPNAIANALKTGGGGGDGFDPNVLSNALKDPNGGGGGDGFDPNAVSNALKDPNSGTVDPTTLSSLLADPNLAKLPPAALQALAANLPPGMTPDDLRTLTGDNFSALPQGADSGLGALSGLSGLSSGLSSALGAVTGATNSPAGTGKSLLSNPNQNGADGTGQAADAAGQAADAAQQALNALQGKGGTPNGTPGFDPKNLKALDGAGGHAGGGGGAGLGARSGAAGLGPAGTPVAATSKGALPAMAAGERALAGTSAGAGGPAGGPAGGGSGGGGGGQRGPGGKEHKANKALRRKKNGEEIFGDIDAVVPVLGADDGEQRAEPDEAAQQPARKAAAERRHSQPQRDPRLIPNVTPGQTIGGR